MRHWFTRNGLAGLGRDLPFAALALLLGFAGMAASARAESRIALVIGNSAYATRPLANPRRDAELMVATLRGVGFEVSALYDGDQAAMKRAILDFGRRLRTTDSVGLFYYAGHGVQVDGENFLIPVGADIKDTEEVAISGVNVSELLKTMERAASRLNIAVLDACRDNPFPASSRTLARGLAPVTAPSGTLMAYATAPGQVALDGTGTNSPYTAALVKAIPLEGVALEEVFRRARRQVLEATNGRQTPWEHSSLTGEFFFKPKVARPEATSRNDDETGPADDARMTEIAAWDKIKTSAEAAAFRRHLDAYPDGIFTEVALVRIAKLEVKTLPWSWTFNKNEVVTGSTRGKGDGEFERAIALDGPTATPAQLAEAASLYKSSAEVGMPAAMYELGRAYDKGRGVPRDIAQAALWYRRAADLDHPAAMASLATMYEFGEGVPGDLAEAMRLYQLSADKGDAHAITSLAYLYAEGKGVARNPLQARALYGRAADKGQPRAMYNLALLHLKGIGGPQDFAQAVGWLKAAGDKGHKGAMRELAVLYDEGRGVARSPALAAELLLRAYHGGDPQARSDLQNRPETWSVATRRELQRKLTARGLYDGRVTGVMDARTRTALDQMASSQ